jgi:hypothetical protein
MLLSGIHFPDWHITPIRAMDSRQKHAGMTALSPIRENS